MNALFALGSNGSGQLGIGHREDVSVPKPAHFHPTQPDAPPIVKVAAGGNHTLLLSAAGRVYWSGDPATGACGLGPVTDVPAFQELRLVRDGSEEIVSVSLIACTWEASFVVARDAQGRNTKLYSLGVGAKGELGQGELMVRTPSATRFKDFPPAGASIVDMSAGMGHVVVVLSNGDAYGWGNCRKGQAGAPEQVIYSPRKVEGLGFKATRAVCAKELTAFFGEPGSGNLAVLGLDKWNLSSGKPAQVPPWADVGASWGNIYILGTDGTLLGWGRDDHGQLPPANLPKLTKIAIGSEHVVAYAEGGDVLSWGWGEHGNCGPQVENNDVKGRWNVIASSKYIPSDSQIASIGAGCATSWVCITPR
ncbi:alpha-tubulin suppressor protein Aats1 [Cordyceps fumosorosea ARSEF 2679]|uniref:Alpha-tubulin suppressor protein Aats1 n=1 Tax=Cordyceps fumosorosea (strain ARSEF 2679) TaxID=1081104 RepID=A0A167Q227_CORFA|nr:alpha-tubulin suppressor protein Aats1 [Cordyceps fumosorosea ARSEF 2679]OAA57216.1 alpha-tubulin suppressor protein Aats1 [Cordyceps fumosorosea ARSEF 2679]